MSPSRTILLTLAFMAGCSEPVYGDGSVVDDFRMIEGFSEIESSGVNLKVTQGAAWEVVLRVDENLLPLVSLERQGEILFVSVEEGDVLFPTALELQVTAPALNRLVHRDGADLNAIDLDATRLRLESSGSGHAELIGAVETLSVEATGSGTRNAQDLLTHHLELQTVSDGNTWVTVSESITGEATGGGDVNVFGDPKQRDFSHAGPGQLIYY